MSHVMPGDTLGRAWIEVSGANPVLVNDYRQSLVSFLAFDRDHVATFAGTGFVMCGDHEKAIVITARHVLDYVWQLQRSDSISHSPSLAPKDFKVLWMGSDNAALMNVAHVSFNHSSDVAVCIITPQESIAPPFAPKSIPLHPIVPVVGQVVHMVSVGNLVAEETSPPEERDGKGLCLKILRSISIRVGTVTGSHPNGHRQYDWPCFTTSIPAEPGMSGGFVTVPEDGVTVAACGVVSADSFSVNARTDQVHCGNSIIACSWPAFGLTVPELIGGSEDGISQSLLELARNGNVPGPLGGIGHLSIADGVMTFSMENRSGNEIEI